jgi:hypothetical protein
MQTRQIRQKYPSPYKKNAVIITIILWVFTPITALIVSEGEPVVILLCCGVAGIFTVFTWVLCMSSHKKYMNSTDSHEINRK